MVNPGSMTLKEWADGTMYALSRFSYISNLQDDDWQRWGVTLLDAPKLTRFNLPDPYQFQEWQEWAIRLNDALSGVE